MKFTALVIMTSQMLSCETWQLSGVCRSEIEASMDSVLRTQYQCMVWTRVQPAECGIHFNVRTEKYAWALVRSTKSSHSSISLHFTFKSWPSCFSHDNLRLVSMTVHGYAAVKGK
ncbi:hypothetical protein BDV28DRAFT_37342 [Aspergillus coremiiformis]|uniref:Secreted protein n=1 Tax=Aspergillus coremiiformis TaxID=138285 RepID=A0A5N6YYH3_9EURO|nr:hypothetical protein BDV28DRAFT_37342 [Aspergillus coremiiformis]